MPIFLRKLILIFIMLWLPLQGYAATAMPFCQHNESGQQARHDMMHAAQDDQHSHPSNDQHTAKGGLPCDNCTMCHMCSAIVIPTIAVNLTITPDKHFDIPAPIRFSLVFPEQPQRPPLVLPV